MPPVDVFSEAAGLQRRRALLESLAKQGAQPQIMGTPGQGIAQLLAALGQSYFANQGLKEVDQGEAQNASRYQNELGSELERFMQRSNGMPGEHTLPPDVPGPQVPEVPGDPKGAILSAMTSRFPEMQSMGKGMLPSLLQKPEKVKPGNWQIAPDGRPYRTAADGSLETGPGTFPNPRKDPVVQIDNYPKAGEQFIGNEAKSLSPGGEEFAIARGAKANLLATSEAVTALANGAKTGQFADFFQAVRKTGKALGLEGIETAANDQLGAVLAQRVLAVSSQRPLAGPMSNADLQFLRDSAGATTTDPQALKRILALAAAQSFHDVQLYNQGVDSLAKQNPAFEQLRRHAPPFAWRGPEDEEFLGMFERAIAGKPTVAAPGKPTAPGKPGTKPGASRPPIRYGG